MAVLLKTLTNHWIERESPFLYLFAAVMVSAWYGGAQPGLLATLLAAVASHFFFVAPYFSFGGMGRTQAVQLSQFLAEGGIISLLSGALHQARAWAEDAASRERAAREEAEKARAALAQALEKERWITKTLQRSLLIHVPAGRFAGLEVASFYEAALDEAEVGGDFFDAFALPDGQVALVVGDVSGKGLLAAARTAEVKFALRALLFEDAAPEGALTRLNRFLCGRDDAHDSRGSGTKGTEPAGGERFIALSLAVVDAQRGEAHLASAGAEPPLIVRWGGAQAVVVTEAGGLPLGVDADAAYVSARIPLARGDTLLLFTDGLTEARAPGAGGDFLEYEGLVALAQEACRPDGKSVADTGQSVLAAVRSFSGDSLRDDTCLLLARR